jgi:hypothetical protein
MWVQMLEMSKPMIEIAFELKGIANATRSSCGLMMRSALRVSESRFRRSQGSSKIAAARDQFLRAYSHLSQP